MEVIEETPDPKPKVAYDPAPKPAALPPPTPTRSNQPDSGFATFLAVLIFCILPALCVLSLLVHPVVTYWAAIRGTVITAAIIVGAAFLLTIALADDK